MVSRDGSSGAQPPSARCPVPIPGRAGEVQLGPVHVWGKEDAAEWQTLHALRIGWSS